MTEFDLYRSPYSWRYASPAMREIWSETHKRRMWRKMWVALAQAQSEMGLVLPEQVEDLIAHENAVDMERALEIEAEIHHDLMAELRVFAEQCPVGKGIIHLGATSMDIEDNADALRIRQSLDLTLEKLSALLDVFAEKMLAYADTPVIGFTHIQPAEPTTLGYRLAYYAQDLLADFNHLSALREDIKGKGFKGAVGTGAAYAELLGAENLGRFESRLSALLDLPFFEVTHQTYPRRQDYMLISGLAGMAAAVSKFAFDLRLMQSPPIGEWSEPFASRQVGSSAMPFKRNPINAEKINSLARMLAQMPPAAWHNAAHSLLERTLDDSANRRTLLPEAFLISDELLSTAARILRGLVVNEAAVQRNLAAYGPFAATERLLMALGKAGADRQEMHERLREHAMTAWQAVQQGQPNPLVNLLCGDAHITRYLGADAVRAAMQHDGYTGFAAQRTRALAEKIHAIRSSP